ncbi:hypothetical protein [Terricaulis silvestris]|uniref:Lipoprotein n=1 Tax=Terricaulis silvestris TaxID=2686094 RepID=A0A6I6MU54_9CAUL|nr:hypothetical protein [Terricaulis silvestris]QGZ96024.1 hypothetical protein DSM104635_02880 [Terricaulis silvestris]
MRDILIAGALALAACSPAAEEAENLAPSCDARAASAWAVSDAQYSVEAASAGPDCARAVATFVVRDASGAPIYAEAYLAQHVMVLADVSDTAAMETALRTWTDPANSTTMATTSALPDWPARANGPENGEFPFYADESVDRDTYLGLRQADVPLLCFVQGMESLACLALRNGQLEKVGVQTFPG